MKQIYVKTVLSLSTVCLSVSIAHGEPRGPLTERNPDAQRCELQSRKLSGEVTLDRNCYYEQSFVIEDPDTILDCDGAELRPVDSFAVNVKRDADRATIRNCYIRGYKGIAVRVRKIRDDETDDDVRALSPVDVVIEHVHVSESESVGVHLLPHTVGVTVRNSILINNSSSGVYMSPYGRHHQIHNNLIEGNGHVKPDGTSRIGWYRREGIAIDGSSEHVITQNEITNNAFGGILLYKNCWEHAAEEPDSRPRTDHARANLIEGNEFRDQPFGVWIAARQSRDLTLMGCGDPTPYTNPIAVNTVFHPSYADYPSAATELYILSFNFASVWPDFAEDNQILNNVFEGITQGGIRVEDDGTEIRGNLFLGDFDYIFVGAPFRARLANQPVRGTSITENSFYLPPVTEFTSQLALIPDEHVETTLVDNYRACPLSGEEFAIHGDRREVENSDECIREGSECVDGAWVPYSTNGCEPDEVPSDMGLNDTDLAGYDPTEPDQTQAMTGYDQGLVDTEAGTEVGGGYTFDQDPSQDTPSREAMPFPQGKQGCAQHSSAPLNAIWVLLLLCCLKLNELTPSKSDLYSRK